MVDFRVWCIVVILCSSAQCENKTVLHIGILMGLTDWYLAEYVQNTLYIFTHALEKIKNTTDVLSEFELELHVKDTKVRYNSKYL